MIARSPAKAEKVEGKVRRLCGEGHELQAQIVGANLSQAAAGPIKRALANFHIHNDEHAVLDYALSKVCFTRSGSTFVVSLRYAGPKEPDTLGGAECLFGAKGRHGGCLQAFRMGEDFEKDFQR